MSTPQYPLGWISGADSCGKLILPQSNQPVIPPEYAPPLIGMSSKLGFLKRMVSAWLKTKFETKTLSALIFRFIYLFKKVKKEN
jgi:hypothetical protein